MLRNESPVNQRKYAFAEGYEYRGQPIMVTEYGGIAFRSDKGWGYGGQVASEEEFLERFGGLTRAIKAVEGICGYCYTQVTDVQQEVNGLLYEDRTPKIAMDKIKAINLA